MLLNCSTKLILLNIPDTSHYRFEKNHYKIWFYGMMTYDINHVQPVHPLIRGATNIIILICSNIVQHHNVELCFDHQFVIITTTTKHNFRYKSKYNWWLTLIYMMQSISMLITSYK